MPTSFVPSGGGSSSSSSGGTGGFLASLIGALGGGTSGGSAPFPTSGTTSSGFPIPTTNTNSSKAISTGNKVVDVLIALGIPAATIIAALVSGDLTSKELAPIVAPSVSPEIQSSFLSWLKDYVGKGNTAYPGQLTTNLEDTILPSVWNAYLAQGNQGTDYLSKFLQGGGAGSQSLLDLLTQTQSQGGPMGQATSLLNNMTQWGGTGGVGNQAMSYLMQFGAPSSVGDYVANMTQYGTASPTGAGSYLLNRAKTSAADWLAPFLQLTSSYSSPKVG